MVDGQETPDGRGGTVGPLFGGEGKATSISRGEVVTVIPATQNEPAQVALKPPATVPGSTLARSTPLRIGHRGIQLSTLEDAFRFARAVHNSRLAPKGLDTPEKILIALEMGFELGVPPMAALANTAVINGRPSVFGDLQLAIVRASGLFDAEHFREWMEGEPNTDAWKACCTVRRYGPGAPVTEEFSILDAKRAGLFGKEGTWQTYPQRMLAWRARGYALRKEFGDVLLGFPSIEESRTIPEEQSIDASGAVDLADRVAEKAATIAAETEPAVQASK